MLKTYINKQKGTQEIVKRPFDNSKKYGTSSTVDAKNQNPKKANMCHYLLLNFLPPLNGSESLHSEMVLLLSINGKRAASTRRITEEIKRKYKQSNGEPNLFMLTST